MENSAALQLIADALRSIMFNLNVLIYRMISFLCNVFEVLCYGKLLENEQISRLFTRITVILGLVMLVRVSFNFIQLLIDPDPMLDSKKGLPSLIKRIVIVIVMLGTSTYIFSFLTNVQTIIIRDDVIPKILLPEKVDTDNFGDKLSGELFLSFWIPVTHETNLVKDLGLNARDFEDLAGVSASTDITEKTVMFVLKKMISVISSLKGITCDDDYLEGVNQKIKQGNYLDAAACVNARGKINDYEVYMVDYNWFFSIIVGLGVLWLVLSYCLNLGARMIQLVFLQIISPVAIIGYLSPKEENAFTNWLKAYFSTYVDIFIRLIVFNFVVYLINLLFTSDVFWNSIGITSGKPVEKGIITALMCLALLLFAKNVPELIKRIFPSTGGSGLNLGMESASTFAPVGMTIGATVGGALGWLTGTATHTSSNLHAGKGAGESIAKGLLGGATGMFRGVSNGLSHKNPITGISSGFQANRQANNRYNDVVMGGGSTLGVIGAMIGDAFGESRGQRDAREISNNSAIEKTWEEMVKEAENTDLYKKVKSMYEAYKFSPNANPQIINQHEENLRNLRDRIIQEGLEGNSVSLRENFDGTTGSVIDLDKDLVDTGSDNDQISAKAIQNLSDEYNNLASARKLTVMKERTIKDENGEDKTEYKEVTADLEENKLTSVKDYKETRVLHRRFTNERVTRKGYQTAKINDQYAGNNTNKNSNN